MRLLLEKREKRISIEKLEAKAKKLRQNIYSKLSAYQRVQISRHFDRPLSLDYIRYIFGNFMELHGDRAFRDDPALVAGTAQFGELPVMVIGHQRGRGMEDRILSKFWYAST